ncbi:MAG: anion permease [Planctomycetales bacterium 4484_113]|nr:MAG: anion permease [Planctomycetales bacterium 4484_113]
MPPSVLTLVIFGIALAFVFDFMNGVNDAANSIATVVATRVLKPLWAVGWAAFFNFMAVFLLDVKVAGTIGKGVVNAEGITELVVLAALFGAIVWTTVCTRLGLPISVSHALVGGLLGAGLAYAGMGVVMWTKIWMIAAFMVISPIVGIFLGSFITWLVTWLTYRFDRRRVSAWFRRLQLVSAALFSLGHGTGDAQKTMGIVAVLLVTAGMGANPQGNWFLRSSFDSTGFVPNWVVFAAHAAIALGTLIGGWRVIKTMGVRLTKLRPMDGFSAETAAATSILGTAALGIPVSTTHTIAGGIIGVGAVKRFTAVRWGVLTRIVWAWVFTLPASAGVAALIYLLLRLFIPRG